MRKEFIHLLPFVNSKYMKAVLRSPRILTISLLIVSLLAACISVSQAPQVSPQPAFVTSTLPPKKTVLISPTSSPTLEATSITAPTLASTTMPDCRDEAILLRDVTIPDDAQVKAGEKFIKTWEFQNVGTCTWTNYSVILSTDDKINAPLSTPVSVTAPKEKVQISMELTAPTADGIYAGYFTLNNANGEALSIGTEKMFWVKFVVGKPVSGPVVSITNVPQSGGCVQGPNADYVDQIVALINSARSDAGLNTLTFNAEIASFSQSHAEDMAYHNFLSHDGSDGTFGQRMATYAQTHGQQITGEILAIGTPQNAMDQWRKDEHWNYVLGTFNQIGVGYAYSSCSDYGGYFTVDFAE